MKARKRAIFIGTSGWSYTSWRGPFFPEMLPSRLHLQYYASRFGTAELNAVFYRTPTEAAVRTWAEQTPEGFVFAWKASKFITHWKRLNQTSVNSIALLKSRLRLLGEKVGPVLFQLPPQFQKNRGRIEGFLKLLPPRRRYAFEFRHPSWYEDDILDLLRNTDIALCISDHRATAQAAVIAAGNRPSRARWPKLMGAERGFRWTCQRD